MGEDEIDRIIQAAIAEGRNVRLALEEAGYAIEYVGEPTSLEQAANAGIFTARYLLNRGYDSAAEYAYQQRLNYMSFAEPGSPEHTARREALRKK